MNPKSFVLVAVLFLFIGFVFTACGIFLKVQKKNQNAFAKIASKTFSILGAITLVYGILALAFRKQATKLVVEVFAIIYLIIIVIITIIFNINLNKNYRNNQMEDQTNDIKKEGE